MAMLEPSVEPDPIELGKDVHTHQSRSTGKKESESLMDMLISIENPQENASTLSDVLPATAKPSSCSEISSLFEVLPVDENTSDLTQKPPLPLPVSDKLSDSTF